jgi:hypothetical protein
MVMGHHYFRADYYIDTCTSFSQNNPYLKYSLLFSILLKKQHLSYFSMFYARGGEYELLIHYGYDKLRSGEKEKH